MTTMDDARESIACLSEEWGVLVLEEGYSGEGRIIGVPYGVCDALYTESMDCTGDETTDVEREVSMSRVRAEDKDHTREGPATETESGSTASREA